MRGRSRRLVATSAQRCRGWALGTRVADDRGSVSVLMCFIVLLGATVTGSVVDVGTTIDAANKADGLSSEAARAATIAIGPVPAADGTSTLQAAPAARTYLVQAGASGYSVIVTGPATVAVTVTVTETTPILGVAVSQTRTHTAQLQVGVTSGQGVQ